MAATILVVEDELELQRALCLRLTAAGFHCVAATNGLEGLDKARGLQPDLIIADLIMPEMDGYAMIRQLNADERTAAIPIVVLTAVPEYSLHKSMEALRYARLMHKPFDSSELLSVVHELVAITRRGGAVHE